MHGYYDPRSLVARLSASMMALVSERPQSSFVSPTRVPQLKPLYPKIVLYVKEIHVGSLHLYPVNLASPSADRQYLRQARL